MPVRGAVSFDALMELLRPFGDRPLVVKDYVKSQKHAWKEACFIPSAADRSAVERVVRCFLDLHRERIDEGLVFREFVDFEQIGVHPKSGMPLRASSGNSSSMGSRRPTSYWDEAEYGDVALPADVFADVASRVQSRFFTMDVARKSSGEWMIVELGDGQVAGLPEGVERDALFQGLAGRVDGRRAAVSQIRHETAVAWR